MDKSIIYYHKPKFMASFYAMKVAKNENVNTEENDLPQYGEVPTGSVFDYCASTLRSLGLVGKYDGFRYMCKAVELILETRENPRFEDIYDRIAENYRVSGVTVERSVRYAISYLRKYGNASRISTFLRGLAEHDRCFSNSKFLSFLAADVFQKLVSRDDMMSMLANDGTLPM